MEILQFLIGVPSYRKQDSQQVPAKSLSNFTVNFLFVPSLQSLSLVLQGELTSLLGHLLKHWAPALSGYIVGQENEELVWIL